MTNTSTTLVTATDTDLATIANLFAFEIEDAEQKPHSPNLLVSWTISPEVTKKAIAFESKYVFIAFIVIERVSKERYRECRAHEKNCSCEGCQGKVLRRTEVQIFPVEKGHALIEINRPGEFIIKACLVFSSKKKQKTAFEDSISWTLYASNNDRETIWRMEDARYDSTQILSSTKTIDISVGDTIGTFGEPPPEWLTWWANLWMSDNPKDTCSLGKRCILAFSIQPALVGIWMIIRAIFGFCTVVWLFFLGWRHASLKPILHPFEMDIFGTEREVIRDSDIYARNDTERCDPKGSFIRFTKEGEERSFAGKILHAPIFWLGCTTLIPPAILETRLTLAVIVCTFLSIASIDKLIQACHAPVPKKDVDTSEEFKIWQAKREARRAQFIARRYAHVTDADLQLPPHAEILRHSATERSKPHRRSSLRWLFLLTKSRVCLPYKAR